MQGQGRTLAQQGQLQRGATQPEDTSVEIRAYRESYLVKWCTPHPLPPHTHTHTHRNLELMVSLMIGSIRPLLSGLPTLGVCVCVPF